MQPDTGEASTLGTVILDLGAESPKCAEDIVTEDS